jgi:hypothetical protein
VKHPCLSRLCGSSRGMMLYLNAAFVDALPSPNTFIHPLAYNSLMLRTAIAHSSLGPRLTLPHLVQASSFIYRRSLSTSLLRKNPEVNKFITKEDRPAGEPKGIPTEGLHYKGTIHSLKHPSHPNVYVCSCYEFRRCLGGESCSYRLSLVEPDRTDPDRRLGTFPSSVCSP